MYLLQDVVANVACLCAGVVVLDKHFLQSQRPMWELGIVMAALPDDGQSQPGGPQQAPRAVLPVLLMGPTEIEDAYKQHWQPATVEAARSKGFPPATLADLKRLLQHQAIRQDQVRLSSLCYA